MDNMPWLVATANNIRELVREGGDEAALLIGTYLNDVREVMGMNTYKMWLSSCDNFGLSDYRIRKLRKLAK